MAAASPRELQPLPPQHPCFGCEARGLAVCGVLGCEDLCELKKLGPTVKLRARSMLFREGDPSSRMFTLTRGSLKLYKILPDGRRHIVGFIYPGEFLGISIDNEHAFTAEAIEDSELCSFPRGRFTSFVAGHPSMEHELYRMAAFELSAAQQQLVLLGRKTAIERLASFLLLLADRAKQAPGQKVAVAYLPMSRGDIADYLGLTKETVSRILSTLRAARLIRLRAVSEIELIDRPKLERASENDCVNRKAFR